MALGVLTLHIHLPGCASLKEKRGRLKPLITKLQREFNLSVAEINYHDVWQDAVIACALVSNDHKHNQRSLQNVARWVDDSWPDVSVVDDKIEIR
ncbi:MAG: DUF503 domain-containing protein [Chloroflexi bacterium]|nr:DUF503 domain-containing protein [Chloroflexota bacterium]